MFADLIDEDFLSESLELFSPMLTKTIDVHARENNSALDKLPSFGGNNGASSILLMQPKLEPQVTIQTKMVPIAPRLDPSQHTSVSYICSTCTQPIHERYFLHTQDRLSRGNYHHVECLRCQCCNVVLAEIASTFYTKDNALLCKSDYLKKYGSRPCSLCSQVIGTNEQIMRVSPNYVYHLSCFTCVQCHTPLVKGDRYVLFNGQPFCEKDNPLKSKTNMTNSSVTKRGSTTSKRGAKAARTTAAAQVQQTFITPSQYPHTGHISLLNNHHSTSTITHSLLSNNHSNGYSSMTATASGDELY